jgi:Derlin-2/3
LSVRGGSDEEDGEESDLEEEEEDDDTFFDDFEEGEEGEDDFAEDNTLDRLIVGIQKTPPLTKGYLTASFIATAGSYVLNKNEFLPIFVLDWKKVLTRAQIWRPFTSFLNFGPFGLGYVMTVHFVWNYMGAIERLHHHKPYDFWIMIFFGMFSMVVGYPIFKLSPRFLGHNLSTFLVYVWSRYHEGMEVNMFELFNTRAELLPWFFLAQVRTYRIGYIGNDTTDYDDGVVVVVDVVGTRYAPDWIGLD